MRNRSVWMVMESGVVRRLQWAAVATPAEVGSVQFPESMLGASDEVKTLWASALTQAEVDAGTWTATVTNWTSAPRPIADPSVLSPTITDREISAGGVKWSLDDLDPYQVVVTSDADLLAAAEALGQTLDLVERTTGNKIRAYHEARPETPDDDSFNIILHRVGGDLAKIEQ